MKYILTVNNEIFFYNSFQELLNNNLDKSLEFISNNVEVRVY